MRLLLLFFFLLLFIIITVEHTSSGKDKNQNELYWPGMFTHTRNLL